MNELPPSIEKGTFGEIFLQLRLLQYSVQAAPPLKDTGNDLIAVRRNCFRAIQVKTTANGFPIEIDLNKLPDLYHILALVLFVDLEYNDGAHDFSVSLDKARIFLLRHDQVTKGYWTENELLPFEMNLDTVNSLFPLE
jgi:hypothetical protein